MSYSYFQIYNDLLLKKFCSKIVAKLTYHTHNYFLRIKMCLVNIDRMNKIQKQYKICSYKSEATSLTQFCLNIDSKANTIQRPDMRLENSGNFIFFCFF